MPTEVARSLEVLFSGCREAGLTQFDGFTERAHDFVGKWINVYRPSNQYGQNLWQSSRGLTEEPLGADNKPPLGFRLPHQKRPNRQSQRGELGFKLPHRDRMKD